MGTRPEREASKPEEHPVTVPAEAIEAAATAIHRLDCEGRWGGCPGGHGNHTYRDLGNAKAAMEAAAPLILAPERDRIRQLLTAYHALYDTVWNKVATVELEVPGYNGLSYDDENAIEEAARTVEDLLASGDFADLLDGPP
jgi:hypothetical protein